MNRYIYTVKSNITCLILHLQISFWYIYTIKRYQSPKVVVPSSAAGASAATLVQPRLQHSAADSAPRQHQHVAGALAATLMQLRLQHGAADSAPGQHQCVPDQARHFDSISNKYKD